MLLKFVLKSFLNRLNQCVNLILHDVNRSNMAIKENKESAEIEASSSKENGLSIVRDLLSPEKTLAGPAPPQASPQAPPQPVPETLMLQFHRAELYRTDLDACHGLPNTCLEYNVIDFYFQYLEHEVWEDYEEHFCFVSPHATADIALEGLDEDLLKRVRKAKYTFFPFYSLNHWSLLVYDHEEQHLTYLSSSSVNNDLYLGYLHSELSKQLPIVNVKNGRWNVLPVLQQRRAYACSGSHLLCNVDMLCYAYAMDTDDCPVNDPRSYAAIEGKRLDLLKIIENLKGKFTYWTNYTESTEQIDGIPYYPSILSPSSYRQPRQNAPIRNEGPCLKYGEVTLTQDDLYILKGTEWLVDTNINFYFEYLKNAVWDDEVKAKKFHFVNPLITSMIKALDELDDDIMKPINESEYTFMPVNNEEQIQSFFGSHWSLLVFVRSTERFYHFDSLKSNGPHAEKICKNIQAKLGLESEENSYNEVKCAEQENSYDCGIFVLCNVDNLCYWVAQLGHQNIADAPLVLPETTASKRSDIIAIILRLGGRLN